ncbi:MAG: zinc ribbon domain-containing protein [Desulfatitalea sp.]|nr:zinc ribbon domain-containing protein [Desulfatitalea sp.]NNK01448.1 zinc ribbon domain-containing protein [Desulfatitalea sp.]
MAIETKQEYLERVMAMEKPRCPHCDHEMKLWEVPPINFSDGLGWGAPFLFLCFNDECTLFTKGWQDMQEHYAQRASMRCFNYPGTDQFECMPVFSAMGGQGQVIDDEVLAQQEMLKEQTKRGFSILADCYVNKDLMTIMQLLTDATEPVRVRIKAAEMIGDLAEVQAVEPLRFMRAGNQKLQEAIEAAIDQIHERHFTRECPFCAEIIKKRAKICKNCSKEVAGQ